MAYVYINGKKKKIIDDDKFTRQDMITKTTSKLPVSPLAKLNDKSIPSDAIETHYTDGEYNFEIIRKAIMTDSYARLMVDKYTTLCTIRGHEFVGPDDKVALRAIDHLKTRISEIEIGSNLLFKEYLELLFNSLFGFSNGFSHFLRSHNGGSGIRHVDKLGNELDPISRLEIGDMMTSEFSIVHDPFGTIYGYIQYLAYGSSKSYSRYIPATEMRHIKVFPNKLYGNPILSTVIDDIRMLRRLEENAVLQSFQYAIPPLVYKVKPATPGSPIAEDQNIINAKEEIEALMSHGGLVTTTDSDIDIPVPSSLLDMMKYIDHAKGRVLGGLHLSGLMTGDGSSANKSTAAALMDDAINHAKYHQQIVKEFVNKFIINDILMDSKFKSVNKYVDKISIFFPEIDVSYWQAIANQEILLYNAGIVSRTESRLTLGLTPMTKEDEEDTAQTHKANVEIRKAAAQAQQQSMPANQNGTKMNASKKTRVNDTYSRGEIITYIDQSIMRVSDANITKDAKDKIIAALQSRINLINDPGYSEDSKQAIMDGVMDRLISLTKLLDDISKVKTELTYDQLITYDGSVASI